MQLPSLFRSKHCFELYSPNVTFVDKIRNKRIEGLSRYVIEGSILHIYFNLRYKFIQLKVLNSSFDDKDRSIRVRWRLIGVKGLSIFVGYFNKEFNKETCSLYYQSKFNLFLSFTLIIHYFYIFSWLDGHSKFELDNEGKIFKHTCDKVIYN